ncbi:MAG TPA: TonB-dependent receptor [Kofleriaceae bacterium]|nr:TonB-dependent receptor [Kofleriaceae bacterium]
MRWQINLFALSTVACASLVRVAAAQDAPEPPPPPVVDTPEPPPPQELTDEQLARLSEGEAIEIFDERPDKPFDRDTEVRLTGEQLAARGAVDLATALALLPDVSVQEAGRGGSTVIIRGASKGQVSVLIDGVLVSDPYYGTFDLTSIPITDIVQIRLATTPQSPIDGVGGPGGVIEVHTRDAIGPQLVIARMASDTLPSFGMSGTARAALSKRLALRIAASGVGGGRSLTLAAPFDMISESRRDAAGSLRLEYRADKRRIVLDGFANDRHYIVPPSETTTALQLIDRENNARAAAKLDDTIDDYQIQVQGAFQYLLRHTRSFSDPTFGFESAAEKLHANRTGGMALVTHPIGKDARWAASATVEHERADVSAGSLMMPIVARGNVTLAEVAGDLQYEHRTVRLDGAVGVAFPFGTDANPWPEAKLVGKWRPNFGNLEVTATGARKGRVPSLRERFQPGLGDPDLAPEIINHGEVRAIEHIANRIHIELATFARYQQGTIIGTTQPPDVGKLINLGTVTVGGIDVLARVRIHPKIEVGGAYNYVRAHSDEKGDDPLSHLPHHKGEAWVQVAPITGLTVMTRGNFFGESFINQMTRIPPYTAFEVSASWQLAKEYLAVLRGTDLGDSRPLIRPGVYGPGRTISAVLQATWD